jgi:hypothetical protein
VQQNGMITGEFCMQSCSQVVEFRPSCKRFEKEWGSCRILNVVSRSN